MPELVSSHHETPFQESRFATGLKGMFGRAKKMLVDAGDKYFFEPEVADTPEQPPHSPTLAALEQSRESIGAIYKRARQGVAESSHSAGTKLTELFKNSKPKISSRVAKLQEYAVPAQEGDGYREALIRIDTIIAKQTTALETMNARASEQQGWEHSKAQADPFFAEDMLSQLETSLLQLQKRRERLVTEQELQRLRN